MQYHHHHIIIIIIISSSSSSSWGPGRKPGASSYTLTRLSLSLIIIIIIIIIVCEICETRDARARPTRAGFFSVTPRPSGPGARQKHKTVHVSVC